jgi:hypothetical protein
MCRTQVIALGPVRNRSTIRIAGRCMCADVVIKLVPVARLYVDFARAREAANQTFARLQGVHGAAHSFDTVVAGPRDEMTVIDNVLFTRL